MNTLNIKFPLFGLIYNWKGLKEENYLYTAEEMQKYDPVLLQNMLDKPTWWHSSTLAECAWKTWAGKIIENTEELTNFLEGQFNDDIDNDDWYWECVMDNNLYGEKSDTLKNIVTELELKKTQLTSSELVRYTYLSECRDFEELKEALDEATLDRIESLIAEYESLKEDETQQKINNYEGMSDVASWYEGVLTTQELIEIYTE